MGAFTSSQNSREEEVDTISNIAYRYPPKSGNYFGSHFIMGGERFDTPQPEAYLFGENVDLNFLGNRPTPFPYPPPQSNEPYKTLKALVNIRKESLRFVKVNDENNKHLYNIEFVFDADVPTNITIYFFATEEMTNNTVSYSVKDPSCNMSKTFHYKKGASQLFSQPTVIFNPSNYEDEDLGYSIDKEIIPIVIHCIAVAEEVHDDTRQSHSSVAVVDHHADGSYTLKGLKQKLFVDGLCYLIQEIYGIENKNNDTFKGCEDSEDGGSECVICMCDIRDTLILPCRHLCLCYSCADSLRYQANNCPICRAPFRALLQIRALQKNSSHVTETSADNVPSGYDAVSLIEALNGPCAVRHTPLVVSLDPLTDCPDSQTAVQVLNRRSSSERMTKTKVSKSTSADTQTLNTPDVESKSNDGNQPEVRMSSLLAQEKNDNLQSTEANDEANDTSKSKSPPLNNRRPMTRDKSLLRQRDSIRIPNEDIETPDEDSEAEKLSPLLDAATSTEMDRTNNIVEYYSQDGDGEGDIQLQVEIIGSPSSSDQITTITQVGCGGSKVDTATSSMVRPQVIGGDESDYYTPEDPSTTILSPVQESPDSSIKKSRKPGGHEGTPTIKNNNWTTSLPGTPLSTASHRSSGDSYSSSSSTRLLLTNENQSVA